jgi:hypothetical protein
VIGQIGAHFVEHRFFKRDTIVVARGQKNLNQMH